MAAESQTAQKENPIEGNKGRFRPAFEPDTPELTVLTEAKPDKTQKRTLGRTALVLGELHEELPQVEWKAVERLIEGPRRRKLGAVRERVVDSFAPLAVAKVAEAVVHKADPSVAYAPPTIDQIKQSNSFVAFVSDFLHVLPFGLGDWLGDWFDRKIVAGASERIERGASKLFDLTEAMKKVKKPKKQFVDELEAFYGHIKSRAEESGDSKNSLVNTTRAIYGRRGFGRDSHSSAWYNPDDYPLTSEVLTKLAPNPRIARNGLVVERPLVRFVTPEIMQGVAEFLQSQGREVELIERGESRPSLPRRTAERFSYTRNKLESVVDRVVAKLQDAHDALPENGESFATGVIELSKKIVQLVDQGHSAEQIADKLRKDVWPKRRANF